VSTTTKVPSDTDTIRRLGHAIEVYLPRGSDLSDLSGVARISAMPYRCMPYRYSSLLYLAKL
jgi:hypothetical protein